MTFGILNIGFFFFMWKHGCDLFKSSVFEMSKIYIYIYIAIIFFLVHPANF